MKIQGISECKRIIFNKGGNIVKVFCYENFRFETGLEAPKKLLKRGKKDTNLQLDEVPLRHAIPQKKVGSVRHLLAQQFGTDWEENEDLTWYKAILQRATEGDEGDKREEGDEDNDTEEVCTCLEEECAIHV